VILDVTIVGVALPPIECDLGFTQSGPQWVVNAYTLTFGGFLLLGGRLGDRLNRVRLFLVGRTGAVRRPPTRWGSRSASSWRMRRSAWTSHRSRRRPRFRRRSEPVSTPYADPGEMPAEARADLDQVFRAGGVGDLLGLRLLDWGPGAARFLLEPTPEIANIAGSVHGGALYTLADSAFEVACNSYGRICVALDVTVHHASAAPLDEPVTAEAVEVSRSARVASYRVTAAGAGGEVRAWYLATAYRTSRWHLGADRWPLAWREAH